MCTELWWARSRRQLEKTLHAEARCELKSCLKPLQFCISRSGRQRKDALDESTNNTPNRWLRAEHVPRATSLWSTGLEHADRICTNNYQISCCSGEHLGKYAAWRADFANIDMVIQWSLEQGLALSISGLCQQENWAAVLFGG